MYRIKSITFTNAEPFSSQGWIFSCERRRPLAFNVCESTLGEYRSVAVVLWLLPRDFDQEFNQSGLSSAEVN